MNTMRQTYPWTCKSPKQNPSLSFNLKRGFEYANNKLSTKETQILLQFIPSFHAKSTFNFSSLLIQTVVSFYQIPIQTKIVLIFILKKKV